VGYATAKLVHSGEQGSPGGGAGWADIEILKADTFLPQLVGVRSLQVGVAMGIDIPISLIVGQDENDVRLLGHAEQGNKEKKGEGWVIHSPNYFPLCTCKSTK
jgi:hypothetical protein